MRKTKLYNFWVTIQTSFWFIPSLMILALFLLSILTLGLDHEFGSQGYLQSDQVTQKSLLSNFLTVGPDGARAVLTTVAGSMITVAGVTFSITIVALTLAASQFGPRLLRNFMQDKSTQFVLGAFSSTFVYCLLILRSIHSDYDRYFVPVFSVNLSVIFAIINVGVLIFFIHHISVSLKAEYVITSVYHSLKNDIDRIFGDLTLEEDDPVIKDNFQNQLKSRQFLSEIPLVTERGGYIQAIDYKRILELSTQNGLIIELTLKAGDFCVTGSHIGTVKSKSEIKEDVQTGIADAFIYGNQRTPEQDVEYAIHQMVEIAVRSLSKGINDPFTAMSCIDYLSSILCNLARKQMPSSYCCDSSGNLRLITKEITYGDFLDSAFNQVRQNSSTSVAVTIRVMEAFARIANCLKGNHQKKELYRHVSMIFQQGKDCFKEQQDIADLEQRYNECVEKIGVS